MSAAVHPQGRTAGARLIDRRPSLSIPAFVNIVPTDHVTVIGHVDESAAEFCSAATFGHPINPALTDLNCRAKFVVDLIGAVGP